CAVIVIEPTGYLSFVNPKFCEMMGYTMEKVKKLHFSKLVHPEDLAMLTENFKKKLSGQQTPKSYKFRALTKRGDAIYVDYDSAVIEREGRIVGIQAVISDITERKKAEEEVRESEEKYRMLFEDANDVILYVNKYGKIIDVNKRVEDIFGYKRDEVVGKNFVKLGVLRPKNIPKIVKLFRNAIGGKEIISILELEVKNKNGKMVPVEASTRVIKRNGKIVGTMNILRDITARKKAEEEIKAKSQFLESLVEQSPLPTFVIDSDGIVVMANKAFLKAYNIPKKEAVLGMNALTEPANVRQGVVKYIKEALSGKMVETPEIEFISPYENKKTVTKSRLFPIFDTTNTLTNVVVVHEDITERKRAEDQIKASLKEKEVLLREIHHRVKNNLQIISSLFNLQSRCIKDKQVLHVFKESRDRIRSMALIHERLYQSKDLARIDFTEYVRGLVANLFQSYKVNPDLIALETSIEEIFLGVDKAIPCGLIIDELVSNSLKYAFPEGRQGKIHIDLDSDKEGKFTLIVSDSGVGFPKDLDFRKTESLGLELVCTLADQLDGTIDLDRSGGSTFKISFTEPKQKQGG
ncbi:MAG: PAS domain S-box protein, partial [Candidatus Aerophobetes bacterium]